MQSTASIDLRSDTVTRPTPGMMRAIADAELGDDVFRDDPTVLKLEKRVAELFGKEAALFVPSGTMANQVAIRAHTEPGHEIICHEASHIYQYEGGAPFALAGCSIRLLPGDRGFFTAKQVGQSIRPDDVHFPRSRLVVIENTHNRGGGSIWPDDMIAEIAKTARQHDLRMHLDGARIMNAAVASGIAPSKTARHFDSTTICFSKGLGAPVGSAVAGSQDFIARCLRFRKMYGGAMRQAGLLAAAALYALDHHVDRLADDHRNAKALADGLAAIDGLTVTPPETNIVYFDVEPAMGSAADVANALKDAGVRLVAVACQRLRAVTHLDVSASQIEQAIDISSKTLSSRVKRSTA